MDFNFEKSFQIQSVIKRENAVDKLQKAVRPDRMYLGFLGVNKSILSILLALLP
jgi:hypothetical protein